MHLSIGEICTFSLFKTPLVERFGRGLTSIAIIFSTSIMTLGLSAAVFGTWAERAGSRAAVFTAALCWSSGFIISALGVATSQLWLMYLGYGPICGIGFGIGYISPVSTLIKWFPDRPGLATGLANMAGRLGWSSTSDYIGRKPIYMVYLGVGTAMYFVLASFGSASLAMYLVLTLVIRSFYGGGLATIPAYLKDLFGVAQVGAIHGRLLTAWSAAGVAGPLIINAVADYQTSAGRTGVDLYTLSLYIMIGVLVIGLVANLLVRPVDSRFHMDREEDREKETASSGATASSET